MFRRLLIDAPTNPTLTPALSCGYRKVAHVVSMLGAAAGCEGLCTLVANSHSGFLKFAAFKFFAADTLFFPFAQYPIPFNFFPHTLRVAGFFDVEKRNV